MSREGSFALACAARSAASSIDTSCVFALVVDSDADKNMAWIPPAGVHPNLSVETKSSERTILVFLRTRPLFYARPTAGRGSAPRDRRRLRHRQSDAALPDRGHRELRKQGESRPRACRHPDISSGGGAVTDLSEFTIWTEAEFERVFPPLSKPSKPNGKGTAAQGATRALG